MSSPTRPQPRQFPSSTRPLNLRQPPCRRIHELSASTSSPARPRAPRQPPSSTCPPTPRQLPSSPATGSSPMPSTINTITLRNRQWRPPHPHRASIIGLFAVIKNQGPWRPVRVRYTGCGRFLIVNAIYLSLFHFLLLLYSPALALTNTEHVTNCTQYTP